MSNGLAKESRIVNPMAKTILSIKVNDQLQSHIDTQLAPREAAKIMMSLAVDLIFGYVEGLVEFHTKDKDEKTEKVG